MDGNARTWFTPKQKAELWERWKSGQCVADIARGLERRNKSGVYRILAVNGGIAPAPRRRAPRTLRLAEREEISRGIATGQSIRQIAQGLARSPSTVSREIRRNGGCSAYRASWADRYAWERALRPKSCRLAFHAESSRRASGSLSRIFPTWIFWSNRCLLFGGYFVSRSASCTAACWRSCVTMTCAGAEQSSSLPRPFGRNLPANCAPTVSSISLDSNSVKAQLGITETSTQSVRAFKPTFQSGPFRAPRFLAPKHVGRKETICVALSSRRLRHTATSAVAN
jgi:hypothetical protein